MYVIMLICLLGLTNFVFAKCNDGNEFLKK